MASEVADGIPPEPQHDHCDHENRHNPFRRHHRVGAAKQDPQQPFSGQTFWRWRSLVVADGRSVQVLRSSFTVEASCPWVMQGSRKTNVQHQHAAERSRGQCLPRLSCGQSSEKPSLFQDISRAVTLSFSDRVDDCSCSADVQDNQSRLIIRACKTGHNGD